MSSKSRLCKIIPAEVVEVSENFFVVSLPDGEHYRVEGGNVPVKKGSLIKFSKDTFLKIINDILDVEEITVLKEEPSDTEIDSFDNGNLPTRERNFAVWEDTSTRLLIDLYKEYRPHVNGQKLKTLKNMWERIANIMQKNGYSFDFQQVESKWKSLVRSYRTGLLQGHKNRKSNYQAGVFEQEIGEILSSQGISFEVVNETQEENENSISSPPNKMRRTIDDSGGSVSNIYLQSLIKAMNRRTSQKEIADSVKQEQRERLINAIQERNDLLKKIIMQKETK